MPDVPLFLLTSNTSFSAAEWFAFILKNLGRATVIGEQTAGGAHPVNRRVLNHRFVLQVPTGEVKDGALGTDFEGTGVSPHIEVISEHALHTAHQQALKALMEQNPGNDEAYEWFLPQIQARIEAPQIPTALLDGLEGYYGSRQIILKHGKLYYSWDGKHRLRLRPISETVLALDGVDDFRFQIRSEHQEITGLDRVYSDGSRRFHAKTPTLEDH